MSVNYLTFIGLIISTVLVSILYTFIKRQNKKTELRNSFTGILFCLLIWCVGLILQIVLSPLLNIPPIYFDYLVYIGTCFLPVSFLIMSLRFVKPNVRIDAKEILGLCIVPLICLVFLWTNDFHHLFYITYSTMLSKGVYGPFFHLTTIYTYGLLGISLVFLAKYSIKNVRFYFLQVIFILLGTLVPVVVNVLGVLGIYNLSIYITPICFSITILCYTLSIYKFGFLRITPIALKNIVNRISDSYIVLNSDLMIVDCNATFLNSFNVSRNDIINNSLDEINIKDFKKLMSKIISTINKTANNDETYIIDTYFKNIKKYFHIEITRLSDGQNILGTLLLFKDVTQHQLDLETIKGNQEILIERERLASLGQMIGGIAHNLKTPIMSISGATEGILDLINEYKDSIGDSEVTKEDHLEIAGDMEEWIKKIQNHLSYMSDIITTVKGQAVTFSDNASYTSFTIDDLIKQVNILMKHELSHSLIELEQNIAINKSTVVKGNINSLVQVVNNIISNAIQAYNGESGQKIILNIYKEGNKLVIKIQDFAGGIPDSVKSKLFKEMTTTKGKNGTGLGLFMSYSNIKAHFNGKLYFETQKNKGTSFFIEIPN